MNQSTYTIRKGVKQDIPVALELIIELAAFEKAEHQVSNTVEEMIKDGFGQNAIFEFYVAEFEGKVIGMSLYYMRYSTWRGHYLYLEDLVVTASHRGKGAGKKLLDATVAEAKSKKSNLMMWQVLDWNESAIGFYKKIGAELDSEWINCKLDKEDLQNWKNG